MSRKPFTKREIIDTLLYRVEMQFGEPLKCAISGEPMRPGDPVEIDHIHADALGGKHEYRNFRPVLKAAHKPKSKRDVQALAKIDRITGVTKQGPKRKIPTRKFAKAPEGFKHFGSRKMRKR